MTNHLNRRSVIQAGLGSILTPSMILGEPLEDPNRKLVLVELFTSQGCDLCPDAERLIGRLLEEERKSNDRIAVLAWHVDYFNRPWRDPFSEARYSSRQMAYHEVFTRTRPAFMKTAENGLYFTPMLMIDGITPMLANNKPETIQKVKNAITAARRKSVEIHLDFEFHSPSGELRVDLNQMSRKSRSTKSSKDLLVTAACVQKTASTNVESGENAGKVLTEQSIVRNYDYKAWNANADRKTTIRLNLKPPAGLKQSEMSWIAFIQDTSTGAILQSFQGAWNA